jgi:hypothetical protein
MTRQITAKPPIEVLVEQDLPVRPAAAV